MLYYVINILFSVLGLLLSVPCLWTSLLMHHVSHPVLTLYPNIDAQGAPTLPAPCIARPDQTIVIMHVYIRFSFLYYVFHPVH